MTRRRPFVPWIDTAVFALVFALPPALADAVVAPDRMTADDPAGRLESLTLPRPVVVGTDALLLPSAARAIAPGDDGAAPLSGFARSERRARTSRAALEAWAPGAAAQFQITTNAWTGLPHRAYGPPLAIASGALDNAAQAEDAARAWLEAHVALWAADDVPAPADLALVKSRHVGRTWFLVFQQLHLGVEVESGRVDLRLRDDGRLTLVGSDWLPGVAVDPRASRLSLGVADASARTAIGFDAAHDRYQGGTRVILPLPGPDGALEYRVAWRVMHRTENPPALWRSYVDANTGETLARENDLRYDTLVGRVTGMVHPLMPTDPLVALPLRDAVLTTTLDSVFTGADGRYSFPAISTGFVIRNALRGPFEEVVRATGGPPVQQQVSAPANDTLNFNWPIPPADSSEADAFYHVAVVRQYVKKIEPLFDALDYRVPVTVNIPALCNAFWDGVGVNFFHFGIRGDGVACANTGMIADVIYHEYGHGRTQFVWAPFAPSGPMHEGLSDYLAATITNQPVIGRGFFGPGTSIRTTQNTQVVNAVSCAGEVHCMGNAISGSVWDMRRNLIAALGDSVTAIELADSLFHFAGYGGSPWHDDYLLDLLVVDDDDGNLLNGTPHYGQICPAFSLHGIPCPAITFGVWVAHVPLGDAGLAAGPFQVDASIGSSLDPIVASSVNLQWRVQNSPWNTVVMTPLGGDDYRAFIPALPGGGRVDYYVTGADAGARVGSSPAGAPAAFHTFYVGNLSTVFADDFEIDRGWSSVVGGVTGRWMRVDPNGTPDVDDPSFFYAPEDDHTPNPAHFCFVTGDTTAGLDVGAADIDGGCQTLLSPVLDLSGRANARLSYWRWFTDETRYDDTLSVAVSPDGGTTWTELERQPFTQNQWLSRSFDVGAYIPLTNQFRFRARTCDGGGGSLLEAGLDDFLLTTRVYGTTSAGDTPGSGDVPQVAFLGAIEPNPARGGASARIAFGVPRSAAGATARASLQIVDLRGRIVQTLIDSPLTPGMYAARWDGTDRRGARVAGGVYFVRLAVDGNRASEKIVRLD